MTLTAMLWLLLVAPIDAFADGLRAKLFRPWTVALGAAGDLIVVLLAGVVAPALIGAVFVLRIVQERMWHHPRCHGPVFFVVWRWKWDWWHLIKQVRLYGSIVAVLFVLNATWWQWFVLGVGGWALWFVALRVARGRWKDPWK